jgi:hypothetical protein
MRKLTQISNVSRGIVRRSTEFWRIVDDRRGRSPEIGLILLGLTHKIVFLMIGLWDRVES